jgi:hypothetical protein
MPHTIRTALAIALLASLPALLKASDATAVRVSDPTTVTELDMGKLKGEPTRLAWSADGKEFYLQTTENAGRPNARVRHYVFNAGNGSKKDVNAEPEWAAAYWLQKSAQTAPDDRAFKIDAKTEHRVQQTTSSPMGGEMARGGVSGDPTAGTSTGDGVSAAYTRQNAAVNLMVLKGETIGEFVNTVIVPGLTFGWAPKGTKLIAYAAPKGGRVIVMDAKGQKAEVAGSKDALLPAWSPDAKRLAWLQKEARRKFTLKVAEVAVS